jgi:2-dehydro-3-deoxyphosphogluconate aldolase/(4S)-4-hydroxy-2-oxoglutarate aldolase
MTANDLGSLLLNALWESPVLGVVRHLPRARLEVVTNGVMAGGVRVLEVTCNTAGAFDMLEWLASRYGSRLLLGAGTVLRRAQAREAKARGARFLVSPGAADEVMDAAEETGLPILPGAMTPTEILRALERRPPLVRVFPAEALGPEFFRALREPLPDVPLVAAGGVTLANARAFIEAGAVAVTAGRGLLPPGNDAGEAAIAAHVQALVGAVRVGAPQPPGGAGAG